MRIRRDAQDRANQIPLYFLIASVLAHILAFLLIPAIQFPEYSPSDDSVVEIDPQTLEEFAKVEQRQIVNSERANNTEKSEDAKYLGERDQKVEKETKANRVDSFRAGQNTQPKSLSLKNLAPARTYEKPITDGDEALRQKLARESEQRTGDMAANNDYLKSVEEGNRTLLNTREFMYFGYYHRIRERLEQAWNTKLRAVLTSYVRSGRNLANNKDYVTRVVVVLDRNGKIRAVKVLEESGARDLDDAAVEAFNRAGPFPNPPQGLVDADGLIKIRWDFILQS